jgi:hypothetical protein
MEPARQLGDLGSEIKQVLGESNQLSTANQAVTYRDVKREMVTIDGGGRHGEMV